MLYYFFGNYHIKLLEFFLKEQIPISVQALVSKSAYDDFSPAHIKESVIRSAIYDKPLESVIQEMKQEIQQYKEAFQKKKIMWSTLGRPRPSGSLRSVCQA
jgi:uncharacterized phage protein gp47/JayE